MAQTIVAVAAAEKSSMEGLDANPTMQASLEDLQVQKRVGFAVAVLYPSRT